MNFAKLADYYARVFPSNAIWEFLSYGSDATGKRREFGFWERNTTRGGEYLRRHVSFANLHYFKLSVTATVPTKIEIGALYDKQVFISSHPHSLKHSLQNSPWLKLLHLSKENSYSVPIIVDERC
jgi:hypothetical protein